MIAHTRIKALNPKSSDTKFMGHEPTWNVQPRPELRTGLMSAAFTWYNYFYNKKDARDMIVAYLEHNGRKADIKRLRGVSDSTIRLTTAWLCRMTMVGLELTEEESAKLVILLEETLGSKQQDIVSADPDAAATVKLTIQDRLRDKVIECAGELEGMFDEFIAEGAKMSASYKPIATIRGMNVAPQMVKDIADIWQQKLPEFEAVIAGKDSDLVEAYSHLTKIQMRNIIKFCEAVINDCGAYVQIKKVERKPRKAKEISPEKRAAKFKYQTEFAELKLKSLPASNLVDKSEAWLYDTKKRKIIHVVADSHVGTFTVKSNSVIGFSTVDSQQRTVRKPAEIIKAMSAAGKPAARKIYKDLTTTETVFNGRGTENLIILKAW
jgi:hypothetical protein|tara:strand:- start:910 stop:2049 length:1140 start_codon:yes stop_codon:yes gene_type:complete